MSDRVKYNNSHVLDTANFNNLTQLYEKNNNEEHKSFKDKS